MARPQPIVEVATPLSHRLLCNAARGEREAYACGIIQMRTETVTAI
jgi:hypothetical protein